MCEPEPRRRRDGWTLFEVVDNDAGLKACGVLITATDEALPDARCTYRALRDIRRALESVPNAVLVDREETGRTATEMLASFGWYGARITDMEQRLFRLS